MTARTSPDSDLPAKRIGRPPKDPADKAVTFSISMDPGLRDTVDKHAAEAEMSRSEFVSLLVALHGGQVAKEMAEIARIAQSKELRRQSRLRGEQDRLAAKQTRSCSNGEPSEPHEASRIARAPTARDEFEIRDPLAVLDW